MVAARLAADGWPLAREAARRLQQADPAVIITAARGSSDNAASFFKYVCEIAAGIPVASLGPSLASVYSAPLTFRSAALLAVSQSGRSPDILAMVAAANAAGAQSIAIVNDLSSPLAAMARIAIPMAAGPETSVAATKTFFASAMIGAMIAAALADDRRLAHAIDELPARLSEALELSWDALRPIVRHGRSFYVVGRGPALAIAQEMALKSKETAGLHAEAYSLAEVMHGPLRLAGPDFPVVVLLPDDPAASRGIEAIERLKATGAPLAVASTTPLLTDSLPAITTGHGATDALAMIVPFYAAMESIARSFGFDPDSPPHLAKVTQTV